jgi:hypothetical protein
MKELFFYNVTLTKGQPDLMVCFYSGQELNIETFYNEVKVQFGKAPFIEDLLLITPSFNENDIKTKLLNDKAQKTLKDRINTKQELLFHTCFVGRSGNFDIQVFDDVKPSLTDLIIDGIFEVGLYNISKDRNLVIEASANTHFIKPSGKHTSKFIDVKNILESGVEISFIATAMLKLLPKNINHIYVDTAGIYSIAYEIVKLLNKFDGNSHIPVDSFSSYEGVDEYSFHADDHNLILISASTSNSLYRDLTSNPALTKAKIVTVVTSQDNEDHKALIKFKTFKKYCKNYFEDFKSHNENECPMCLKENSVALALNKSTFVFEPPRIEYTAPLSKDSDNDLRALIHHYHEKDAFRCLFDGVDGKKEGQVPEYFIDVRNVIKEPEFQRKLKNKIIRHFPLNTDFILHCKDKGAKELAENIQKITSKMDLDIECYEGRIPASVTPKKGIMVVAGSIESGKALLNISRDLRKYNNLPLTYVIGFAKYASIGGYNKLKMDLRFTEADFGFHQVHEIEKIQLPIYAHKKHSWSTELDLLIELSAKYRNDVSLSNVIEQRILQLKHAKSETVVDVLVPKSSQSNFDKYIPNFLKKNSIVSKLKKSSAKKGIQGLGKELFLTSPEGKHLVLGKTFAFWNTDDNNKEFDHQATVYFTISSIFQRLRTTPNDKGIIPLGEGYVIRQLDAVLFDRFNEGVIHACILRAGKSRELDYRTSDAKSQIVGSLIERMLLDPESDDSTGLSEFLLALSTKKLQVKKAYLTGFYSHKVDKVKHPMTWVLLEYSKYILFETPNKSEMTAQRITSEEKLEDIPF